MPPLLLGQGFSESGPNSCGKSYSSGSDPGHRCVRGKLSAQLGTIFWGLVLVAGLIWNGLIAISRWHDSYLPVGTSAVQAAPSEAWYSHLDGSNSLLWLEFLFVGSVAVVMYFRSRKGTRHLKVRPGARRYR